MSTPSVVSWGLPSLPESEAALVFKAAGAEKSGCARAPRPQDRTASPIRPAATAADESDGNVRVRDRPHAELKRVRRQCMNRGG